MARLRHLLLWAVTLGALQLAVAGTGVGGPAGTPSPAGAPAAAGVLQPTAGAAVVPLRAAHELRAATQPAPLRSLVVAAVLAGLVGLMADRWRRSPSAGRGRRALAARRHTISLRAPPLLRLA